MAHARTDRPHFSQVAARAFQDHPEEENLRFDRDGRPRTAYSLRHTYICLRLMEGADIYQIAKNCRTSVEMIEKYYAAHIKTRSTPLQLTLCGPRKTRKARKPSRTLKLTATSR
jgi:integrase